MTIDWSPDQLPHGTTVETVALATPDRVATGGVLYRPAARSRALVALMHPRVDFARHYLIPPLVRAGYAVWAQRSRTVNNDVSLVHEQLLIDIAVAHAHLERLGFDQIHLLGNSGGASLYCFYLQQAALPPDQRLTDAPSGTGVDLHLPMPMPAGLILLAPHHGQGELLLHCIDPSVVDETDPASVEPSLDLFSPENGFREPPQSSSYEDEFLRHYRNGQRRRVLRIDERMRAILAEKARLRTRGKEGDIQARRLALAAGFVTVHRTDADPRTVDLSIDASKRDYGSIFGRRPDVTNFGVAGFCRLTTPEAWLSTWSGLSSKATLRLTAPDISVPTLLVSYTADNSVFPSDIAALEAALGAQDVTRHDFDADHYGYAPGTEDRLDSTADAITSWLAAQS